MNYGLYTSYLGMRARMRTLEAIANNVANASTTGFKSEFMYFRSVEASPLDAERVFSSGSALPVGAQNATSAANNAPLSSATSLPNAAPPSAGSVSTPLPADSLTPDRALGVTSGSRFDFSQGSVRLTGRSLDVALEGDGFLVVQTPQGERYTRDGSLTIDANGQLVTSQGHLVVGQSGPITLRPGEVAISPEGNMRAGGQEVGQLKIVRFENTPGNLLKQGDNLYYTINNAQPQPAPQTRVHQAALESSNVNAVGEMALMMQANREFESLQRSITLMMNVKKAAGDIAKL